MNKIKTAILVTGTPGVGKTTVANKLASRLDAACICITEMVKNEKLITATDEQRQTLVADTKKLTKRVQDMLMELEGNIILEGHYVVDVVPKEHVNTVVVLRRDPHELKEVLEKRGYSEKKVWENIAAEVLDVCLWDAISTCGVENVCEIDVSNKTVETVIEEIVLVLERKQECTSGTIDWLGKLEITGELDEFLKKIG
ncbi:MAG: adenylate kinase family protein [Candidatus Bathyarchaeota archaeon]|nr:adenylate kinase family protein [Candidatus Bathyarchaeum sp.]